MRILTAPYLRFIPGGFIVGIPARDMTLEEAETHGGTKFLIGTGLYALVEAERPTKLDPGPKENKSINKGA